jgi:hypothetical protein
MRVSRARRPRTSPDGPAPLRRRTPPSRGRQVAALLVLRRSG